nr:hypothetical protein CFP56_05582 [Quercus suber]
MGFQKSDKNHGNLSTCGWRKRGVGKWLRRRGHEKLKGMPWSKLKARLGTANQNWDRGVGLLLGISLDN